MPRSQINIEAERQTLIGMLKEADLSEAMVRKIRTALTVPSRQARPPMPIEMTVEEAVERLRKQKLEPSVGISHDEVLRIASQW